jgi:DNA-binding NtrC family response regulator
MGFRFRESGITSRIIANMQLKNANILVIDDDEDVLVAMRLLLKSRVREVVVNKNPNTILSLMAAQQFDLVVLDMNFNGLVNTGNEGIFWLNKIKTAFPTTDVVLITAYADIDLAVRSLKLGAADFIVKPWKNEKILDTITDLLSKKNNGKPKRIKLDSNTQMIGDSDPMQDVFLKIKKVAPTDANILILGENGTGKELIAQALHEQSHRRDQPFVKVDVGALTASLFESELFGYKKGAFTDAREDRKGRFEAADGGTLFLDEIGNITLQQQARLLSVLQNRRVTPLGSNESVAVDIRLICATNLTMALLADEQHFRKDLMYRINTVDITVPPLRERNSDIDLLADYFIALYAEKYGKNVPDCQPSFTKKLHQHTFPGNVRELQYALERALIMSDGNQLTEDDLTFSAMESPDEVSLSAKSTNLEDVEKATILNVIDKNKGNISKSAIELGLTRTALYRRLNKYDL